MVEFFCEFLDFDCVLVYGYFFFFVFCSGDNGVIMFIV